MPLQSPIHSFVDFEDRLSTIVLPSYKAQLAFQVLFSSDMEVPRTGDVELWVGNEAKDTTIFKLNASIYDVCFWGKITGIDGDADFPIVVGDGQIIDAGTYNTFADLVTALQAKGFNVNEDDLTFLQCCSENLQDYEIAFTSVDDSAKTLAINFFRGLEYIDNSGNDQETDFNSNNIKNGDCYSLAIVIGEFSGYTSNLFERITNKNYLTFISYYNNEDAYDFHYPADYLVNKLWLPFYLRKPNYAEERKVYRKSDKTYKVQYATIEKQWEAITDWLPDPLHDRIIVTLAHDNIHITSDEYNQQFAIDEDVFKKDDYAIDWQDEYVPGANVVAQAKFRLLQVFAGRNSNCERRPTCVALPTPPECIEPAITDITLPDATVGEAYDQTITLTGSAPFALSSITKPTWLILTVIGNTVHLTGTPESTDEDEGIEVSFTVTNCSEASASFSDVIDVLNGTHFLPKADVSEDADTDYETIQIKGQAGETVTVTVTNYSVAPPLDPATVTWDGTLVTTIGQTFSVVLDGTGLSAVIPVHIDGNHLTTTSVDAEFTITAATGGNIGSPDVYQISKRFS